MNPEYDTILTVKNMEHESVTLIQDLDGVEALNFETGEDFRYYFIEKLTDFHSRLYGCETLFKKSTLWLVKELYDGDF